MANSLLVGGLELCIGNVANTEYILAAGPDFGTITPDTTTISSLLLDGDIVTGDRTGNKTWQFGVIVKAPDRQTLSLYVDTLLSAVKPPPPGVFPVVWTPDGGSSANYSATLVSAQVGKILLLNASFITTVILSFVTGPFGQSSQSVSVTVPAAGGPSQFQVDGMNTPSPAFTSGTRDTTHEYEGASCMAVTMTRTGAGSLWAYHMTAPGGRSITSVDLSSYISVSFRFRWDQAPAAYEVGGHITLTDSHGASASSNLLINVTKGSTRYQLVSFDMSTLSAIDLTTVTGWSVTFTTNSASFSSTPASTTTAYVDDLRAYPPATAGNATGEGQVLTIPGVIGSARTPLALELDLGTTAITSIIAHRPPVTQDPDLTILAGLASGSVVVPAANSNYDGTYTVVALMSSSPAGTKTLTATFTQKIGSTVIGTGTVVLNTTSGNFMQVLGEITLPIVETPPENQSDALTIALTTTGSDVFTDVLLLDTEGQTMAAQGFPSGTEAVWIDMPDPTQLVGMGQFLGAASIDRTQSFSVMPDLIAFSPGSMLVEPGDNRLLVASPSGAPNITATYFPRFLDEALQ